jgi:hypothetical protein
MSIESIVRPFVARDVTPPRRVVTEQASEPDTIRLEIGRKGGNVKTLSGSYSETRTFYVDGKQKEVDRKETPKRITNPNDPSQYVDVKQLDEMNVRFASGREGWQNVNYKFKNPEAGN